MKPTLLGSMILVVGLAGCITRSDDANPHSTHTTAPSHEEQSTMSKVDLKRLEDELYRHGLASFKRIRGSHPMDKFYAFAFFTNGEFNYVAVTASSYEGLAQVAGEYKKMARYKHKSIDDLKLDLKWSPCDSPLHGKVDDILGALDPFMESVAAELDRRFALPDDGKSFNTLLIQVQDCFVNALKRIDSEGVFGGPDERQNVVANLLMGDQSDEERIGFAKRLNPPEAVERFVQDLDAAKLLRGG